jgi:2-amino-4-hydroxy-6-hydroxymethyldihydropteridine diphosphokinase
LAQIYLGLGSNLGDRTANLRSAVAKLQEHMLVEKISPVYETTPWGPVQDQPLFLNVCLQATTDLTPQDLLPLIKRVEESLGRDTNEKWGPFNIDIDLLFYDDLIVEVGDRTIPHGRIQERPFVLLPLADIAPDYIHPILNQSISSLLAGVSTAGITQQAHGLAPDNPMA